jgi:hypothetical protein
VWQLTIFLRPFFAHCSDVSFTLVASLNERERLASWKSKYDKVAHAAEVGYVFRDQVLRGGLDLLAPQSWLNLDGNFDLIARLRSQSGHLFPTATLFHGLSPHFYLHHLFLKILLSESDSCDSFVCSSGAAEKALRRILEMIADGFEREHRVKLRFNGRFDRIPLCVDTDKLKPCDKSPFRKQLGLAYDEILLGRVNT